MKGFLAFFSLFFLPLNIYPFAPFITKEKTIEKGNEFYKKGKFKEAYEAYIKAKNSLPESAALHYNIAITEIALQKLDSAKNSLERGLLVAGNDIAVKEYLYFALGFLHSQIAKNIKDEERDKKREEWRKAVEYFKQGLILNSGNKELRDNLEIALLYAYPSCAKLDDEDEVNNNREEAKFITLDPTNLSFKKELMLCPKDEDWYRIPLNKDEILFAKIDSKDEKLSLSLFSETLNDVVAGDKNEEEKNGVINKFKAIEDGQFFLRVSGNKKEDGIPYTLNVQAIPPCPKGDDGYEENDDIQSAKEIGDGEYPLRICSLDDDWFSYFLKKGEERSLSLQVEDEKNIFLVEIFDEKGILVDIKERMEEGGSIKINLPKIENDFKYLIRVFGGGQEGFYILKIGAKEEGDKDKEKQEKKEQEKKQEEEKKEEQKKEETPMEALLKELEENDENLEAKQAILQSPYREYQPEKDW